MVKNLEVQLTKEHLQKLLKVKPINALSELIWNSLDADADKIEITFEKNYLGGIEHIVIKDNGHGIHFSEINDSFGKLGGSKKLNNIHSPSGRQYHGKLGQGRYSGFVLGDNVKWQSLAVEEDKFQSFSIESHIKSLNMYNISYQDHIKRASESTGVEVTIMNLNIDKVDEFHNAEELIKKLSIIFAPYLLAYKQIEIYVDGILLNPQSYIIEQREFEINFISRNNNKVMGKLIAVEWKDGSYKNTFLCSEQGIAYEEENSGLKSGVFSHTFYLKSKLIDDLWKENELIFKDKDEDYIALKNEAEKYIREIYREKLANEAANEIQKLKKQNIYPYVGEPKNEIEKVERQVFDICAFRIIQHIPDIKKNDIQSKQFTYRLLKEALESNPSSLGLILKEVLNLPTEQQNEMANLLEKTSLSSMINTAKLISDRMSFINGLEQILFRQDYNKKLKERSQLHKILLGELWLFGEQYQYGYDDISLKNVLKEHLFHLDREELLEEVNFNDIQGLNDIPDIGLWKQFVTSNEDHYENLVIELKRPSRTINQKDANQIENYAFAIQENKHFDKEKTKWKFILIGIKLDDFVKKKISQDNRPYGLLTKMENVEVWIKEWSQIIQEAKGKHKFLKDKLELEIKDNNEGLNYLRSKYKDFLPD